MYESQRWFKNKQSGSYILEIRFLLKQFFIICNNKSLPVNTAIAVWASVKLYVTCQRTIISSSKGPHSASILRHSNGVGAAAGHLPHTTDVLYQCGHVSTLTVTVTCTEEE